MWQYFWSHVVYHLMRWFPHDNRWKARIVIAFASIAILVPQIYVLALSDTSRYCNQPLLPMLIVSVLLTFCMMAFSCLFIIMEPIPWEVKLVFHIFGGLNMIAALCLTVFTSGANCDTYTVGLYWFSVAATVISIVSLIYFGLTVPFWIINRVCKNSVLDKKARDGFCYEPVTCCSCVWHI